MELLTNLFGSVHLVPLLVFMSMVLLAYKYIQTGEDRRMPPGPSGFPLLGVLPQMFLWKPYVNFTAWAERYGDVVMVRLGGHRIALLSSIQTVREAFVKNAHATADRPQNFLTQEIARNRGILSTNGSVWKEQRRFALSTLRDFGMGKIGLEETVLDEARDLCKAIEAKNGEPFDLRHLVMTSFCNVIFSMVVGRRYDHGDPVLHDYTGCFVENLRLLPKIQLVLSMFPWMRYLPGDAFGYWRVLDNVAHVEKGLQNEIDEHKRTYDPDVTRDYIDAFISKMKEEEGDSNSTFTDPQLLKVLGDFFVAGTETSSTTIRWAILYMLHYPDVQDRLRKSIEENTDGSLPSIRDRKKLVLLDAVLNEVARISSLGAGGLPHETSEAVTIGGYYIPAKTLIIPNMWKIHKNPDIWPNPENFDPDRFIDEDGKLTKPDSFMPFSVGNRSCLGESLAKMELFLFFGCLIKHFRFEPETPGVLPSLEEDVGLVRAPRPFMVRAVKLV